LEESQHCQKATAFGTPRSFRSNAVFCVGSFEVTAKGLQQERESNSLAKFHGQSHQTINEAIPVSFVRSKQVFPPLKY
jgi:hypothetical protein